MMLILLKRMFENKCPECKETLSCENDVLCYIKICPHGHYKEETYPTLGVKIVYNPSK